MARTMSLSAACLAVLLLHGCAEAEGPAATPFRVLHTSLEIYDRHAGTKLYEDVPLPDGSRVLGGGRFLYLLLDRDFPPWRIAKLRLLT